MTEPALFKGWLPPAVRPRPETTHNRVADVPSHAETTLTPSVGVHVRDVFERATDPDDPLELRDLFLGRVEAQAGAKALRHPLVERWRASRRVRTVDDEMVLTSRTTVRFVKELFNSFFRDDLYGVLRSEGHIILSSGSVQEPIFGIPSALVECVRFAFDRGWYGYSDCCGREATRAAIAALENARLGRQVYDLDRVAITLGGSFAVAALADFIRITQGEPAAPALCQLPNYPPLVEAVARRFPTELVPLACTSKGTDVAPLIRALRPSTPLVLLQTVTNPTGTRLDERALETLIRAASPRTMVILDECHECLGPTEAPSPLRAAPNVIRVRSISKAASAPGLKLGWMLADARILADYYEYASTSYGSPPSIFYLFLEVLARFERWRLEGVGAVGAAEIGEFEAAYRLSADSLQVAYASYVEEQSAREAGLVVQRTAAVQWATAAGFDMVVPSYSVNVSLRPSRCRDDYSYFRETLAATGVAVYPGVLAFCLGGGWLRMSPGVAVPQLQEAFRRLEAFWGSRAAFAMK
jgi:aspartate/methionine/tyrosine aminotransferase